MPSIWLWAQIRQLLYPTTLGLSYLSTHPLTHHVSTYHCVSTDLYDFSASERAGVKFY